MDGVTELEVGYHVVPALQGRGYATEAAAACRDYARTALSAETAGRAKCIAIAIRNPPNK